jgi:DNA-binding LacI/PurR family transcriptional regulator
VFADPFFPAIVRGIADTIADTELQLVLLLAQGERQQRKVERYILQGHADGVVMMSLHGDDTLPHALVAGGIPIVLTGRPREVGWIPFVDADNRAGARTATQHLLATRSKVATITGPLDMTVSADRYDGYRDALEAAGIPVAPSLVVHSDFTAEGGRRAMQELLEREPGVDGVFAASDLMAFGALRQLAAAGRRVPEDVAVVGFDDVEDAATASPPLTTMRQPFGELTRAVADLLRRRIAGEAAADEQAVFPTELVRRASA